MNDSNRLADRDQDQLKKPSPSPVTNDQEPLFPLVFEHHQPDCIVERMPDLGVRDAMLPRRITDLHLSRLP